MPSLERGPFAAWYGRCVGRPLAIMLHLLANCVRGSLVVAFALRSTRPAPTEASRDRISSRTCPASAANLVTVHGAVRGLAGAAALPSSAYAYIAFSDQYDLEDAVPHRARVDVAGDYRFACGEL